MVADTFGEACTALIREDTTSRLALSRAISGLALHAAAHKLLECCKEVVPRLLHHSKEG